MPICDLKDFGADNPWGIVRHRRKEIESAGHGGFNRILEDELSKRFISIEDAAKLMDTHTSTARIWLSKSDPRYILDGLRKRYFKEDVQSVADKRKESKRKDKNNG